MQNYVHNSSHFSRFLQNEISNAMYISSHKELVLKLNSAFYLGSFRKSWNMFSHSISAGNITWVSPRAAG